MRIVPIRLLLMAVLIMGLMALVAPAASAASSSAERLLAAGAGQAFVAPAGASSFAAASCYTDPEGDVVNLEDDGSAIDEPRADIVQHCVTYGADTLTLSATVAEPTDPDEDINWNSSLLGWFVDVDGDDSGEFFVEVALDDDGNAAATVLDRAEEPAEQVCDAGYSYADGTITVNVDADCIGDPDSVAVSPGYIYDQRVEDLDGVAVFDKAPNGSEFETPVDAGAFPAGVTRLEGAERIATAIDASQAVFGDDSTDTVVLARDTEFPDALAGGPLAVSLDAPILLTRTDSLPADTAAEIDRVTGGDGTVVLLGGELAINADVEAALAADYDVVRYGGTNRFETAVAIADALGNPDTILAADGGDFQDAVAAGPAAASVDGAVLLTDGATVPPATEAYLAENDSDVTAIGVDATIALPLEDSVAGTDPISTSVAVAEAYFPDASLVGIGRVDVFADTLAGGAIVANPNVGPGPILLVETDSLPASVEDFISDGDVTSAIIFGGVNAVSADVEAAIESALS